MVEKIIFTPQASEDIAEGYDWYEQRELGLGEDFLRCVEACLQMISRHPQMFPPVTDAFRRALIRRFPYEIFYEPSAEGLVVYSVFHSSQERSAEMEQAISQMIDLLPRVSFAETRRREIRRWKIGGGGSRGDTEGEGMGN